MSFEEEEKEEEYRSCWSLSVEVCSVCGIRHWWNSDRQKMN